MSASELEKEESIAGAIVLLLVGVAILTIGCTCAYHSGSEGGQQLIRTEAVERGYAEWVPDKEGNTTFRWKEVAK